MDINGYIRVGIKAIMDCVTIVTSSFRPTISRAKINQSNDMELIWNQWLAFDWLNMARDIIGLTVDMTTVTQSTISVLPKVLQHGHEWVAW